MLQDTNRVIRQAVTTAKTVGNKVSGVVQKAKDAVSSLGKERFDRKTYVSPSNNNQNLIMKADTILKSRPNILNESDQSDPDFRTVVEASAVRSNKAK